MFSMEVSPDLPVSILAQRMVNPCKMIFGDTPPEHLKLWKVSIALDSSDSTEMLASFVSPNQ